MAIALIIQRFDLTMQDPSYTLLFKYTLTIKPYDFKIHAKPRIGRKHVPLTPSSLGVPRRQAIQTHLESTYTMAPTRARLRPSRRGLQATHLLTVVWLFLLIIAETEPIYRVPRPR